MISYLFIILLAFAVLAGGVFLNQTIFKLIEKSACQRINRFYDEKHDQEIKLHRKLNTREIELLSLKCGF